MPRDGLCDFLLGFGGVGCCWVLWVGVDGLVVDRLYFLAMAVILVAVGDHGGGGGGCGCGDIAAYRSISWRL